MCRYVRHRFCIGLAVQDRLPDLVFCDPYLLRRKGRRVYNAYSEVILEKVFAPIFAELDKQTPEQLEHTLQIFRLINKNSQT